MVGKGKNPHELFMLLTAAVSLCSCVLWAIRLSAGGGAAVAGMVASLAGAVLSGAALMALKRYEEDRRQTLEEYEGRIQSIRGEVTAARAVAQREIEAYRSTLTHSLRMPISVIQGYADLLANDMVRDPETQRDYLQKISQRTQYMSDVMRRQRTDESLDRNRLAYTNVDLVELAHQSARDMEAAALVQTVNIQVLSAVNELIIEADDYLLNRVMFNLLENALKYMGRPGTVTIRVLQREKMASVLVQDDGMGLPSEEAEHVFKKNYQGTNHVAGQGYGLYLVKQAIEVHGGTVSARCAPGRGMGITFEIPLRQPLEKQWEPGAASEVGGSREKQPLRS